MGDIEELQSVAREALGPDYVSEDMFPRFDLLNKRGLISYVESSRYCNFRCSFCSLTAEGGRYLKYDLDYVRRQILAAPHKHIVFIDNNFYGNDRQFYLDRVAMLRELRREGRIKSWSGLVTEDFFRRSENATLARESGCQLLFSGVESFDEETLRSYNKRHNTNAPQFDTIRTCLDAGITFAYGIMLDPSRRTLESLHREIALITGTPEITLPAFFTLSIPLPGTPYFRECLDQDMFLPNVRLRHFDGVTMLMKPIDPMDEVLKFCRDLISLRGYRGRVAKHTLSFVRHYRGTLSPLQLYASVLSAGLICTETLASSGKFDFGREVQRQTYLATTESLDQQYTPSIRIDPKYESYFQPIQVTDDAGRLTEQVAVDLAPELAAAPPSQHMPPSPGAA